MKRGAHLRALKYADLNEIAALRETSFKGMCRDVLMVFSSAVTLRNWYVKQFLVEFCCVGVIFQA